MRNDRGGLDARALLVAASALHIIPSLHRLVLSGSITTTCLRVMLPRLHFCDGSLRYLEYTQTLNPPPPLSRFTTNLRLPPVRVQAAIRNSSYGEWSW